jgi:uncharacterized membrane protein (UPF0136 family)
MSSFAVGFPSRPNFASATIGTESVRAQLVAFKPADTARISTAVMVNDPNLQFGIQVGRYLIEAECLCQLGVGTSGGIQLGWSYGGTFSAAYGRSIHTQNGVTLDGGIQSHWRGSSFPTFVGGVASGSVYNAATELHHLYLAMVILTTTAGNLALTWAQQTSTALNTTLNANSILRATRIS